VSIVISTKPLNPPLPCLNHGSIVGNYGLFWAGLAGLENIGALDWDPPVRCLRRLCRKERGHDAESVDTVSEVKDFDQLICIIRVKWFP